MQGKKRKSISYDKYGYLFVAPFFITFLIFQLYPIFFTFRTSLTDASGWSKVLNNSIIGFENYVKLFTFDSEVSRFFWQAFGNTVVIWIFNFVPQIGMALILASWFTDTHLKLRCQGAFKVLIFMPNIITAATIAMLFLPSSTSRLRRSTRCFSSLVCSPLPLNSSAPRLHPGD